jgi:uncharacterized protein (TIGR02569 family)
MQPPPTAVVEAFGGNPDALVPLSGGQGGSWRAGAVVVKRSGGHPEASWLGPILSALPANPAFRLARPVQAQGGAWTVNGWEAANWLAGAHQPGRWTDALAASQALHTALRHHVPTRPVALDRRPDNPWTRGDQVAWGERPADTVGPASDVLGDVGRFVEDVWRGAAPQLIHGDLGLGNLLFADDLGLPPAVIDFSPYWRPAGFALAVLVADAVAWQDAPAALGAQFINNQEHGRELLARAIIYRTVTCAHLWGSASDRFADEAAQYRKVAAIL